MVMEDDWDLYAVVRGCTSVSSNTTTSLISSSSSSSTASSVSSSGLVGGFNPSSSCNFPVVVSEQVGPYLPLSDPSEARSSIGDLHELYMPFFPKSHPLSSSQITPMTSSFSHTSPPKSVQIRQKQHHINKQSHASSLTTQRSKRRKNQLKKVCQVPAESLSSDIWAWRKYGQKPIKGSPYPRGYYRCSSSKGCSARKQVERNRSDPGMFIVTYTAEHNHPAPTHRNSLAGSTRQKPTNPLTANGGKSDKSNTKTISPASSGVEEELPPQCMKSESKEAKELTEEEDEFGLPDMALTDDFFMGLDELDTRTTGDLFADQFPPSLALPSWVANKAATAAGGG